MFFLYWVENKRNKIGQKIIVFGRVPFFYYVVHIFLIHVLAVVGIMIYGRPWHDMILTADTFINASLRNYGYNLWVVYLIWIVVIIILYPVCKRYNNYKSNNRDKKWLSYL